MVTQSHFNITTNSMTTKQLIPANLNVDNYYNNTEQLVLTSSPLSGRKADGLNTMCVPEYFTSSGGGGLEREGDFRTTDCWGRFCF